MSVYGPAVDGRGDDHEQDVVMPGFRFHPTEEELIEFYLRRKVEGKRFNVDLIAYLDLYRYDPWELPAFATIGEKEWFFYVPRDRKYRNGDRPNRVTTSGYWKATGADRMIRAEGARTIGLKKTLVFYSGKAPKGVRTGWIMTEYRLPHNDTHRSQQAEIALCRVHKRAGLEDRCHLTGTPSSKPSFSRGTTASTREQSTTHQPLHNMQSLAGHSASSSNMEKIHEYSASCSTNCGAMAVPVLPKLECFGTPEAAAPPLSSTTTEEDAAPPQRSCMGTHDLASKCRLLMSTSFSSSIPAATFDELNRVAAYHQSYVTQTNHQLFPLLSQPQLPLTSLPSSQLTAIATDKFWEWNPIPEPGINFAHFK